ncbi:transport protein SEC31, partial [Trifolium medium]|nr:transport protein SEC31 [Trifolium medium]
LATSAAIISELEKKKQQKKEEQQRLDEEGAAIAEAVALHVLLDEDADDSYNKVDCKTWDDYYRNLEFFMGGKRACLP